MEGYKSISGNFIRIDAKGDSEGNFTAFAVKPHNYTYITRISKNKFSCGIYPVKVSFQMSVLYGLWPLAFELCYFRSASFTTRRMPSTGRGLFTARK